MIPFHPKFGSAEDAPGYGPSASEDKCENCAHYRNLGSQGYCEKFSFMADPAYSCDDFRPAGVVKESSVNPYLGMSGLGAAALGGKSLYESKKKLDIDKRFARAGLISDQELAERKKEYLKDLAFSGTLGAAGGAGLTYGAKHLAMPAIRTVADDVVDIAGRRADSVVSSMDDVFESQRAGFKSDLDDVLSAQRAGLKSDISDIAGENLQNVRDAVDPLGVHRRANARETAAPRKTLRERLFGASPRIEGE